MTMPVQSDPRLKAAIEASRYPLLFAAVSGAHLYGFPSPDSDFDLRGAHILPLPAVVGLEPGEETIEVSADRDGLEIDLVTHDVKKFFGMLLKKNGYVLEQVLSPLVVHSMPEHEEFKGIARGCITRYHVHHYLGFFDNQWKLFAKESPPRVKPLLYVYRVLLTGIHLMRTGEVQANLPFLNARFRLPYIDELIARKTHGTERGTIEDADFRFHESECQRLLRELEAAAAACTLPERPTTVKALNDLLIRLRLANQVTV